MGMSNGGRPDVQSYDGRMLRHLPGIRSKKAIYEISCLEKCGSRTVEKVTLPKQQGPAHVPSSSVSE